MKIAKNPKRSDNHVVVRRGDRTGRQALRFAIAGHAA